MDTKSKNKEQRRQRAQARNAKESPIDGPDMSNVVVVPTVGTKKPVRLGLRDLNASDFPAGPVEPVKEPTEETVAPEAPIEEMPPAPVAEEPAPEEPEEVVVDVDDDVAVVGDDAEDNVEEDMEEETPTTDDSPANAIAANLRSIVDDATAIMTQQIEVEQSAPEILKILDEQLFPALAEMEAELQEAKDQGKSATKIKALEEAIGRLKSGIEQARKNREVAETLDRRDQREKAAQKAAAQKERAEQEQAAQDDRKDQLTEMWSYIPEDADGRRNNDLARVVEALKGPGDEDLFVITLPPGTKVPSEPDANGKFTWVTMPGNRSSFVLVKVTLDRIEQRHGDSGPYKMPIRIARVLMQVGEGLCFDKHLSYRMDELGAFLFAPWRYVSPEQFQQTDAFHPLKVSLAYVQNKLYRSQRQAEAFAGIAGTCTVTELVVEGEIGTARREVTIHDKIDNVDRPLEVALRRETEKGCLTMPGWGPMPSDRDRLSPRLSALIGRRGDPVQIEVVNASIASPATNKDGTPRVECSVKLVVAGASWPEDNPGLRRTMREQLRILTVFVEQALIAEHVANDTPDEPAEEEAASPTDEANPETAVVEETETTPVAEVEETEAEPEVEEPTDNDETIVEKVVEKRHRHSWRKSGFCACGVQKPVAKAAVVGDD